MAPTDKKQTDSGNMTSTVPSELKKSTIRTNYTSLDMLRMSKLAKENPDIKPIPLINLFCKLSPEISEEQKRKNINKFLSKIQ
jgi:hypothetical protein